MVDCFEITMHLVEFLGAWEKILSKTVPVYFSGKLYSWDDGRIETLCVVYVPLRSLGSTIMWSPAEIEYEIINGRDVRVRVKGGSYAVETISKILCSTKCSR